MKKGNSWLHAIAMWLVVIGGVNWGLVGLLDWNLVEVLFGSWEVVVRVVYILVGLSALVLIPMATDHCKKCMK
jgi:uncharacterized membrane protein YuzA (DUF378 family)